MYVDPLVSEVRDALELKYRTRKLDTIVHDESSYTEPQAHFPIDLILQLDNVDTNILWKEHQRRQL